VGDGRLNSAAAVVFGAFSLVMLSPQAAVAASPDCVAIGPSISFNPDPGFNNNRTDVVTVLAGERLRIRWSNLTGFSFRVNGAIVASGTPGGDVTYVFPADGTYTLFHEVQTGLTPGQLLVECSDPATTPTPTPPTTPTPGSLPPTDHFTQQLMADYSKRQRIKRYWDDGNAIVDFFGIMAQGGDPFSASFGTLDRLNPSQYTSDPEFGPALDAIDAAVPLGHAATSPRVLGFIDASRLGDGLTGDLSVLNTPNFVLRVKGGAAVIDDTFASLAAHTVDGWLSVAGMHRLSDVTGVGYAFTVSGTRTEASGVALDSSSVGGELMLVQVFGPNLVGGLDIGYDHGMHATTIGTATGKFNSSTFWSSARLQGSMTVGTFMLTPAVTGGFDYDTRPDFVDSTGATVAGSTALAAHLTADLKVERPFLTDSGLVIVPSAGFGISVDHSSDAINLPGVGAVPSTDVVGRLSGGVRLIFENGASATVQGNYGFGSDSRFISATAGLSVPIN
jgi:hypothetical protein